MSSTPFTVLMVDDSPVITEMYSAYLRHAGYKVEIATDGLEALEKLSREPIDLILLDIVMPRLDGYGVLQRVRVEHPPAVLPIIMATSLSESEDMVRAFELGANDYVTKPIDKEILLARMQAQLRSKVPARQAAESIAEEIRPGVVLEGKYRLDSLIDKGSFGSVYRGAHLGLERPVAIKLLAARVGRDPANLARFQQEGVSACQVRHPNAVEVHDFSISDEGIPYLVMELLEGLTLEEEIRRHGTLQPRRLAEILYPVCQVLAEAHALGIVHRDIKPQNIFLHRGRHGEWVKVLDFGIAKMLGKVTSSQKITQEGSLVGTPAYMAPERLADQPYGGASDIYSVGVILYEALTGRRPFAADSGIDILEAIQVERRPPPALSDRAPGLPIEIEQLVNEALATNPADRPLPGRLAERFLDALGLDPVQLRASRSPSEEPVDTEPPAAGDPPDEPDGWVATQPDLSEE